MPYIIKKNPDDITYKVISKNDPHHIYAFSTRRPHALISAIEIHKKKK